MEPILELQRLRSPAPKPQSLAWDGDVLWMGSRETRRIYAIDAKSWTVRWETAAPGVPYGMTVVRGELRVLCGEAPDDRRLIRRCVPYRGFDDKWAIPCPDDTGSQMGWDGMRLHVSQWYPKKVIPLDERGQPGPAIAAPHGICGQVFVGKVLYLATTDDEETTDYWLTRFDLSASPAVGRDVAHIPFAARALAFDGRYFWTNHREQNEIVSFTTRTGE